MKAVGLLIDMDSIVTTSGDLRSGLLVLFFLPLRSGLLVLDRDAWALPKISCCDSEEQLARTAMLPRQPAQVKQRACQAQACHVVSLASTSTDMER